MADSPILGGTYVEDGQNNAEQTVNDFLNLIDGLIAFTILDRDLTAPPGSPNNGDAYIPAATATGDWATHEDEIALYYDGWVFITERERIEVWVADEDIRIAYNGTAWIDANLHEGDQETGITASTTQSQGQQPLTKKINEVSSVANPNDVVTLPAAVAGDSVYVFNADSTNTLDIFPATGDAINALSVNTQVSIAAGKNAQFIAIDATTWRMILSA